MSSSDQPQVPASASDQKASLAAKAKLLEGVDFIENEGDVEAVESAVVKIQSTFRGKKIRSKLGGSKAATTATKAALSENKNSNLIESSTAPSSHQEDDSLSKKLATMQVNDKTTNSPAQAPGSADQQEKAPATSPTANLPEDVAATKIQAGFKGYKTRKELAEEGKLAGSGGQGQGQQGDQSESCANK